MRTLFVLPVMTAKGNLNILFALLSVTILFIVVWLANKEYSRYQPSPSPYFFNGIIQNASKESKYTNGSQSSMWTKRVQLCIMFNLKNMSPKKEVINLLLSYYSFFFNHIMLLFDGDWNEKPSYIPKNVTFSGCRSVDGELQHLCLPICLNETWGDEGEPVGYLYIADDMFVNLTMMSLLPLSNLWYLKMGTINYTKRASLKNWHWNRALKPMETVINNLPAKWKQVLVKYEGFPDRLHAVGTADTVYVPHSLAENMTDVLNYVHKTAPKLFCEVALPLVVDITAPTNRVHFIEGYLWGADRTFENIKKKAKSAQFVHPIKLSDPKQAKLWISFMEEVKAAALEI